MIASMQQWWCRHLECPQTRYLTILVGWLTLFWLPTLAGEWWSDHFHAYQALTSLAVIWMARKLYPTAHWADYLGVAAMFQIIHAVADYGYEESLAVYNGIQIGFNALEALFLIMGAKSEWHRGRDGTVGHSGAIRHPDDGNHQRKSHA